MKKSKKTEYSTISLLLSIIMSVGILILLTAVSSSLGYFHENTITGSLQKSEYGVKAAQALQAKTDELLKQAGLPTGLWEDMIDESTLYTEFAAFRNNPSDKTRAEEFGAQIKERIYSYLDGKGVKQTEDIERTVEALGKDAGALYQKYLMPSSIPSLDSLSAQWGKKLMIIGIIATVVTLLCAGILWKMEKYHHRAMRYISAATIASAIWYWLFHIWLQDKLQNTAALVQPDYYENFMSEYLSVSFGTSCVVGVAAVVIAIGMFLVMFRLKKTDS